MPWTTTDEFNVVPKTQRMSLASFPGHNFAMIIYLSFVYEEIYKKTLLVGIVQNIVELIIYLSNVLH